MSTPDPVKVGGFVFRPEMTADEVHIEWRQQHEEDIRAFESQRMASVQCLVPFPDPRTGKPQRVTVQEAAALIEMVGNLQDED